MSDQLNQVIATSVKSQEQGAELLEKLAAVAQPGMVFSEPVTSGDTTVITASEVSVALGFGYGMGAGTDTRPAAEGPSGEEGAEDASNPATSSGSGGGGGGGGVSSARPVAVITIGPEGVQVQPVLDPTKIGLALIATVGGMLLMLGKMRRAGRR